MDGSSGDESDEEGEDGGNTLSTGYEDGGFVAEDASDGPLGALFRPQAFSSGVARVALRRGPPTVSEATKQQYVCGRARRSREGTENKTTCLVYWNAYKL